MTTTAQRTPEYRILHHSHVENAVGLATGIVVVSLGLFLLHSGGDVTGGTAGLSLLLSYATPLPFGALFVLVNLPFFLFAVRGRGWGFILRSGFSIAAVSALSSVYAMPQVLGHLELDPFVAAIMGSVLAGVGVLVLFRHGSSLGGFNIVALILQDRFGWRAGYLLMCADTCVVALSFFVSPWPTVLASAIGAIVMNFLIALNHRPGRYVAS
ncbi:YitT family protein [Microbacterium indicum]|uniref:YitT family protein n=1 Tax=Microbacterium indicum TaxID=358100 RepID=UPI00040F5D90|nr:YitT family protein [Microbacterium indicum]